MPNPAENINSASTNSAAAAETLKKIEAGQTYLRSKDNELAPMQEAHFHGFSVELLQQGPSPYSKSWTLSRSLYQPGHSGKHIQD